MTTSTGTIDNRVGVVMTTPILIIFQLECMMANFHSSVGETRGETGLNHLGRRFSGDNLRKSAMDTDSIEGGSKITNIRHLQPHLSNTVR